MKIVFTNGCFDWYHAGHAALLKFAREQGDLLVVGLNNDESVRALKGPSRPINSQECRLEVLQSVRYVDRVIVFGGTTVVDLLSEIRPDVWVKGADYALDTLNPQEVAMAREVGVEIVFFPVVGRISTTGLLAKYKS